MNSIKHKSYRFYSVFFGLFLVCFLGLKIWQYHWPKATIILGGETLNVLVAKTPDHHFKGLGGRDTLAPYDGMLFLFNEPQKYAFVMRDMRFSIDIIWLFNGVVVDIAPQVPLERGNEPLRRYMPRKEANMVLEVPMGWSESKGVKIGDNLDVRQ